MDYKLKRFCIVGCLSVMLLVFLLVIYFNQEKGSVPSTQGASASVEQEQEPKLILMENKIYLCNETGDIHSQRSN